MNALHPYLGEAARVAALERVAREVGGTIFSIGSSVQGRDIPAVRIAPTRAGVPRVLVHAAIHGVEWIATEVAFALLARAEHLKARAELVVVPVLNVDGAARTERQGGQGTIKELRCNANGVDLNRNFPIPALSNRSLAAGWRMSGSSDPHAATYRGSAPLSEPEAVALHALATREQFAVSFGLHSFMGTCIPPCVRSHADARAYAGICAAFRAGQRTFGARFGYPRLANRFIDVLTGEAEDDLHHAHGTWALTVESFSVFESATQHLRAPSLFWRFNPREPGRVAARDAAGILAALDHALALPRPRG